MKLNNSTKHFLLSLLAVIFLGACDTDDPEAENVEETITKVTLTFSPVTGGDDIVVTALDADGDGPQDVVIDKVISLESNFEYELSLKFENTLETPTEDITEEIREEGHEHLILFGWADGIFADPANGDINNNRNDINYLDEDDNGLPIGLQSSWTTGGDPAEGEFRVVLKHQPDGLKTETSGIVDGATDVDITFDIEIGK